MSEWKKYPREIYDPSVSRNIFTDAEARREYSRLRTIANKRLASLERQGLDYTKAYQRAPEGGYPTIAELTPGDLRAQLGQVARFLSMKSASVTGIRAIEKATLETLQEHGYDFLNKKNIRQYMRFMEAAKRHYGDNKAFPSEEVMELFERASENPDIADPEIVQENFEYWMDANNWSEATAAEPVKSTRGTRAAKKRIAERKQKYDTRSRLSNRRQTRNTRKKGRR